MAIPKNLHKFSNRCEHGFYDYCPHGCFQVEFELAIMEFLGTKTTDTVGSLERLLQYKQAEARQLTSELSEVLSEIANIEERLQQARGDKRKWNY